MFSTEWCCVWIQFVVTKIGVFYCTIRLVDWSTWCVLLNKTVKYRHRRVRGGKKKARHHRHCRNHWGIGDRYQWSKKKKKDVKEASFWEGWGRRSSDQGGRDTPEMGNSTMHQLVNLVMDVPLLAFLHHGIWRDPHYRVISSQRTNKHYLNPCVTSS